MSAGKRGRIANPEAEAKTPLLRNYLVSPLPVAPLLFDWASRVTAGFPMFDNDKYGDCWIASVLHKIEIAYATVGQPWTDPSDSEVDAVYFDLTGGGDTGLDDMTVLNKWSSDGLFGTKATWARIDIRDRALLKNASYAFGGLCLTGELPVNLPEQQFDANQWWTLEPGHHPPADGHAFCGSGASILGMPDITWGAERGLSWPWWRFYGASAYAIFLDVFTKVGHGPLASIDTAKLRSDLEALKG